MYQQPKEDHLKNTLVEVYGEICLKKAKRLYQDMKKLDEEIDNNVTAIESVVRAMILVAIKEQEGSIELVQDAKFHAQVVLHFKELVKGKCKVV